MPISPLARILFVSAAIAFPGVLLTIHEPLPWLFPLALVLFFGLWGACLLRLTLDGAAFDERAFHATRPEGTRMAVQRVTAVVLLMLAWVMLLTLLRGLLLQLGAAATFASISIAATWMVLITMAGQTIMHLTTTRARPAWQAPVIIFGPAAVLVVITRMSQPSAPHLAGRTLAEATINLHATTLVAALAFTLALMLAMGWRKRRATLAVAACAAMLAVTAPQGSRLFSNPDANLPPRTIRFLPADADDGTSEIRVHGLLADEYLSGVVTFAALPSEYRRGHVQIASGYEGRAVNSYRAVIDRHFDRPITWVRSEFYQPTFFNPEGVEDLRGTVRRIRHEGEVPFATGGWIPLAGGGSAWIHRTHATDRRASVAIAFVQTGTYEPPGQEHHGMTADGWAQDTTRRFHVVALHPDGTRAIRVRDHHPWRGTRSGLGVNWADNTAYFYFQQPHEHWSIEEWSNARLILFSDSPVGFVERMVVAGG